LADIEIWTGDSLSFMFDLSREVFSDEGDSLSYDLITDIPTSWIDIQLSDGLLSLVLKPATADTGCYQIAVSATDRAQHIVTDTFNVCVKHTITHIDEAVFTGQNISVYPNPGNGLVNIAFSQMLTGDIEVYVHNIAGALVLQKEFKGANDKINIDLSEQVSGMYFITVRFGGAQINKKYILNTE
jgi:hypothetical protein